MSLLSSLNTPQRTAVTAPPGPVLVLAGPGSGKTRVLTHRIAWLIDEQGVAPWNILAVTFTNKAAKEMRHRIGELVGDRPRGLTMGTFHATCARLLRREADHLPEYGPEFVIYDTDDQRSVVKQALRDLNLDDKKFTPNRMLNGISSAKNELIPPALYAANNYIGAVTQRVYERYQEILQANNAMDFDDLLMNTVQLLDDEPDVLAQYQERYQHVLVDEFQDTNTAQYALLKRLAGGHHNIFAVGDSDQSIYKWRGADFRNINRFREAYPGAQIILLEQNYRSTQIILDAAKAIIQHNPDRVHKELFTERDGGRLIEVRETYDGVEEAETVIALIEQMMLEGQSAGDVAVMYRTNAQSRVLEEAFLRSGMPYRLVGATRFYNRREIRDLIAYLRVIHNPADTISFNRIVNTPTRGIGAKTQAALRQWAATLRLSPAEALVDLVTNPDRQHSFNGRALKPLTRLGDMLHAWFTLRDQVSVGELLDLVLDKTDYRTYIDDSSEEGQARWENVMEFRGVAVVESGISLSEFLEQVALVSDVDALDEDQANAPTLLTLHAAKGLEFPVVIITGLEDGMLPHSRSLGEPDELAEERRLFYVGLTRAKDRVYLLHAFRRTFYGETEVAVPSRFLRELPEELLTGGGTRERREATRRRASSWQWSRTGDSSTGRTSTVASTRRRDDGRRPQPTRRSATTQPSQRARPAGLERRGERRRKDKSTTAAAQYRTGQRVRHAKFGAGIVIESRVTGVDEEVVVAFADVGIKKLAASLAGLEVQE